MKRTIIKKILREGLTLSKKKYQPHYVDDVTGKEFPASEIDKHFHWGRYEYDNYGNKTYYENSKGYWIKQEYDANGNQIYYEDNWGVIKDNRNQINEGLMLPYKKTYVKYFDEETDEEFPYNEIDEHPNWYKIEYDQDGKTVNFDRYDGYWHEWKYGPTGNPIYFRNSRGKIIDDRNQINEGLTLPYKPPIYSYQKKCYPDGDPYGNYQIYNDDECYWAKGMQEELKHIIEHTNNFKIVDIRLFDKYQGPYAIVQIKGKQYKIWADEGGKYWIDNFIIDNTSEEGLMPGFLGTIDKIIDTLNNDI